MMLLQEEMSVVELIRRGNLDSPLAAFLWIMLEHRASIIVAAGPRQVGKSTVLHALTAFLPSDTAMAYTQGVTEDFSFIEQTKASSTFIVVNELSDHTPYYLWDTKVARLFDLLEMGYAMGATMHADRPEEVISALSDEPANIPPASIAAHLNLIIFLGAFKGRDQVIRRITAVCGIRPNPLAPGGVGIRSLAAWQPDTDTFTIFKSPEALEELAQWAHASSQELQREVSTRAALLDDLLEGGTTNFDAVRDAVLKYMEYHGR
ncbi:MAG: putative type secretion system protein [Dehalococcoidia bacterium]|nr:putative type secretion system protein [Dehalococcoidia bacterium]